MIETPGRTRTMTKERLCELVLKNMNKKQGMTVDDVLKRLGKNGEYWAQDVREALQWLFGRELVEYDIVRVKSRGRDSHARVWTISSAGRAVVERRKNWK